MHSNIRLREVEDIVPETSLEVLLHLREVKVRAKAALDELVRVVEEVKGEIEERPGDRGVVDRYTRLVQMPSTGTEGMRG